MKKTNEDRLELFADLIEPAADIFSDRNVAELANNGVNRAKIASSLIKNHKAAVITILARLEGQEPENYVVPGPFALAGKILKLLNDPEIVELFTSQSLSDIAASSGSATENTGDGAK